MSREIGVIITEKLTSRCGSMGSIALAWPAKRRFATFLATYEVIPVEASGERRSCISYFVLRRCLTK